MSHYLSFFYIVFIQRILVLVNIMYLLFYTVKSAYVFCIIMLSTIGDVKILRFSFGKSRTHNVNNLIYLQLYIYNLILSHLLCV